VSAGKRRWPQRRVALAALLLAAQSPTAVLAQDAPQQVVVTGTPGGDSEPFAQRLGKGSLARVRAAHGDSASLLRDIPGVSLYGAGGVSSLPVIRGLADDRLRTQVDGMDLVAACPNHMNPALSYIDPSNVGSVKVYAGVTPVSAGGDSIGGTIQMDSAPPLFAADNEQLVQGQIGGFARSNGAGRGSNLSATWANSWLSLSANTSASHQGNYRAARGFKPLAAGTEGGPLIAGDVVASSAFTTRNDDLSIAWRHGDHLLQLKLGEQRMGLEGFPNQRMDMTANHSRQTNLRYTGRFEWGELVARLFEQRVNHEMDMGPDRYHYGLGMPMDTEATTRGAVLQASVELDSANTLRLGAERQTYVLYDWWPPVGGVMGPNAFWNVDFGQRNRAGAFAEWEHRVGSRWLTQFGLRGDRVMANAGPVQGYDNGLGALWGNEAAAFNALQRARSTQHWDATAIARYTPSPELSLEAGFARKTHSPNLYQRYPWSTQAMAALMNNFVGDGNGYVGNPELRPEVAHTASLSADWHDEQQQDWTVKANAYWTEVHDFIDAQRCTVGQCSASNATARSGFVLLQYANAQARLRGWDLSLRSRLSSTERWGEFGAALVISQVQGQNRTTGDGLYNIMPLNAKLALSQQQGAWQASVELVAVAAKRRLSQVRNEMATAGYGLVNLRAAYDWDAVHVELGIDNLLNRFYAPPLGGAYVAQGPSMTSNGTAWGVPVPGMGRSLSLSTSLRF